MLNQFYNYISTLLLDYFKDTLVRPGDRFSLHLDKYEEVQHLVEALRKNKSYPKEEFKYRLDNEEEYTTFTIPYSESKLIIAYTSDYVKPDFLVTLRNLVGEQKNEFKGTALISIVSEQLDSIQGGSGDLQKEGMPLHPEVLHANLQSNIKDSELNSVDQLILSDTLTKLMAERHYEGITFFDFEDIFIALEQEHINDNEYHKFGIFKDVELGTYPESARGERLQKNQELFESVQTVHDYGLDSDELEKTFSPEGSKILMEKDWINMDFSQVHNYHLELDKISKEKKVTLSNLKVNGGVKYWERVQNEKTAAGRRKHHLVIFNDGREEIEVQASFGFQGPIKSLSKEFMNKYCDERTNVEVKNTNIFIRINTGSKESPRVRVVYKHDKRVALGAEINIIVVPFEEEFLESFRTRYLINQKKGIELQFEEEEELIFGDKLFDKNVEIERSNQTVSVSEENRLLINPLPECFNDENETTVNLYYKNVLVPLILKNELPDPTPIDGRRIWKLVRESNEDMQWTTHNNRLILGNQEFYFHSQYREYFEWENQWIIDNFMSGEYDSGTLRKRNINLSEELMYKYNALLNYFKAHQFDNAIPSLCSVTDDYRSIATAYIRQYCEEVEQLSAERPAGKSGVDLFKLGMITSKNYIYITSFHPLMVAYKLKTYELLDTEELDSSILNRLNPEALIPFIYDENNAVYKPEPQQNALEWIVLKPIREVSISDSNNYLAQVVTDKMSQFKEHFSYLFVEDSQAPLLINVINISNDKEILRGVLQWMLLEIRTKGINSVKPIELTLYQREHANSSLDLFSNLKTVEEIEEEFDINLNLIRGIDKHDVLNQIRKSLVFYKRSDQDSFRYAHISFYNMDGSEQYSIQPMQNIATGISIDGLYASVPSMREEESYVSGFGLKSYSNYHENDLLTVAYYVNELAVNTRNEGQNSYQKGHTLFSRISSMDETLLEKIFQSSYWVTFIDPYIDLDFFNDYKDDLVIIHYSDQYSSSNKYDAITVTDKSSQYFSVIEGYLKGKGVDGSSKDMNSAIKAFNTFNGEWLLRIIGSKGYYDREKLSIISAIKYALSYFDHGNILWVPISMEEVLRVAGVVGLSKSDGVFTSRNLGIRGSQSDDLLLVGLEESYGNIKLHFYPIEVKMGKNANATINKGKKQVLNTKKNITSQLIGDNGRKFTGKFYRNFFVQLFLANARKIEQNNVWPEKDYQLSENIIQKLLQDQFEVDDSLRDFIGDGAIISFREGAYHRSAEIIEGVLLLQFIKEDGYQGLIKTSREINKWLHENSNDFIKEDMLAYAYKTNQSKLSSLEDNDRKNIVIREDNAKHVKNENIEQSKKEKGSSEEEKVKVSGLLEARIKLGTAENSNKEIFWEYGNKSLANRHLLISGKSGQGKTYFMQCLLLEKSKIGIPSIVIDYTEGFLPNQLEPEFQHALGDKLVQKIVYSEKFPMNPFQKNIRDIGGTELEESSTDVAERVRGVFASVYKTLGIQQLNAIYEAVLSGVERYGKDMNLLRLRDILERDDSNYARTALSQIRPLIDRNPFNHKNALNWKDMLNSNGNVYIIQLTGFPREVQLLITEFILWDLWNYSVKYGQKNHPIPIVMDEAQNLDITEASPSARILTEGRKFGWSAWYATQFLRSQLETSELSRLQNSVQKIYFSPPEQELSNIAATFTKDTQERRHWEGKLASLKKGQCIVHAPLLKPNGELSAPIVTVVNISPLSDRI